MRYLFQLHESSSEHVCLDDHFYNDRSAIKSMRTLLKDYESDAKVWLANRKTGKEYVVTADYVKIHDPKESTI